MNTQVAPAAFKEMQTDIQVSMDDVVSAFVSQYENNLYARKKELTASIKDVEERLDDIKDVVKAKVNGDSYKTKMPFGLELDISSGEINWIKEEVLFNLSITTAGNQNRYGNTITVAKTKPIPAVQIRAHKKATEELSGLRAELGEVLVSLKSVTRKERQVRGRIAMRKLEDSGYASLMQDEELAKLVQLND